MTKNFIYIAFCLSIVAVIIIIGILSAFLVIEYGDYEKPFNTQKTMELVDDYRIVVPLITQDMIYVYHDNDRNVTCYIYDDGISCIPDWFLEVKDA